MSRIKLVYVTPSMQSFVKSDIGILRNYFDVRVINQPWGNKKLAPLNFIAQFFSMLTNIFGAKFIIVNFGGYWAFWGIVFGKAFGKKVFIVTHGTDCASIPEINYGSLRISLLKRICKFSYHRADAIFPVSESLIETELSFDPAITSRKQGLLHYFPTLQVPLKTIYNGLDDNEWIPPEKSSRITNSFLAVMSSSQFTLKGGDLILKIAREYPDCNFYFAGIQAAQISEQAPENVRFLGFLAPKELLSWYQKSEFYFQLSGFEGFGCALCEAMLCGAIPIGSNTNHIPQIIGDCGFIIPEKSLKAAIAIMDKALSDTNKDLLSINSRLHIQANYSLTLREKNLIESLEQFTCESYTN
ncbi:glycosyltransferase involved in cell wall biosynthesis [Algoriphagus sp. 4150]|uniref:glycosyltransferase family 4 protein n=1 Tax=Algoriphagus sp. 4150 TaxID=2817756 RepID=UPI00285C1865|nr:glycosyltransferase family 4 protein [Algoriphagus sp. 4150]MDR7130459.1 glycosyltransferase involved in cell wall biosynthesis [Algoriphagus sp. 4150]